MLPSDRSLLHVAWGEEGGLDSLLLPLPRPPDSLRGQERKSVQKESWGGRARKGQAEHFESSHYVSGISRLPLSALK